VTDPLRDPAAGWGEAVGRGRVEPATLVFLDFVCEDAGVHGQHFCTGLSTCRAIFGYSHRPMPIVGESSSRARGPRVTVDGSVAVELNWVIASFHRQDFRDDHHVLAEACAAHPELERRTAEFWSRPDELIGCHDFMELLFLAHFGGVLFSLRPDDLLADLPGLCAEIPADVRKLPMISETPSDRLAMITRLARLKKSAARRDEYAALLNDVWKAVRGPWEAFGRATVDAAIARRRELVARGADWSAVARTECDYGDLLNVTVSALPADGRVAVVPAYYAHRALHMDAPGLVLISVGTDISGAEARAQTEALARGLRTLADPTRLALLGLLRARPRTITELTSLLDVAQPTVSNHVKLLRDAGLVTESRDGTRRQLVVSPDAVAHIVATLDKTLGAARTS